MKREQFNYGAGANDSRIAIAVRRACTPRKSFIPELEQLSTMSLEELDKLGGLSERLALQN